MYTPPALVGVAVLLVIAAAWRVRHAAFEIGRVETASPARRDPATGRVQRPVPERVGPNQNPVEWLLRRLHGERKGEDLEMHPLLLFLLIFGATIGVIPVIGLPIVAVMLLLLLLQGVGFGARSIVEGRNTGMLELLLLTDITSQQIVRGYVRAHLAYRGVGCSLAVTCLLLWTSQVFFVTLDTGYAPLLLLPLLILLMYPAVVLSAMWISSHCRTTSQAMLAGYFTMAGAFIVLQAIVGVGLSVMDHPSSLIVSTWSILVFCGVPLAMGGWAYQSLVSNLRHSIVGDV
jgi:hypothetical protein